MYVRNVNMFSSRKARLQGDMSRWANKPAQLTYNKYLAVVPIRIMLFKNKHHTKRKTFNFFL